MDARCHHCGRAIRQTQHTRSGARVDYYRMHTGLTEPAVIEDREGKGAIHFERLVVPQEIFTCLACSERPEVAARLESAWARGLPSPRREAAARVVDGIPHL